MGFKFKLQEIIEKSDKTKNPLLVTFQNGHLIPEAAPQLQVKYLDDQNSFEVVDPKNNVYTPSSCTLQSTNKQFIAIRNKKTRKVRLIEIENISLMNKILAQKDATTTPTSLPANSRALDKMFADKRVVKRMEQRERLKVDARLVQKDLKDSIAGVDIGDVSTTTAQLEDQSVLSIIPWCNRKANDVSEVYKLNKMISIEDLGSLADHADDIIESNVELTGHTLFFKSCFEMVKTHQDITEAVEKISALLYMDSVLKFATLNARSVGMKATNFCSISSVIHDKIVEEFCVRGEKSLTRPLHLRDKALCHCLVIGLLCCNFVINLQSFKQDSGVGLTKLSQLCRVVGIVPVNKGSLTYVLKLPLPALPTTKAGKTRRSL